MTTLITADNGTVSGSAGLKQSADSSGILALATGSGTTAVTIDASQNVGIGTSSPKGSLDVTSAGAYTPVFLSTTNTGSASQRNWMMSTSWNAIGDLSFVTSNAIGGNPVSAGTTRMMIDSSGNVGIGTTTPDPYAWGKSLGINGTSYSSFSLKVGDVGKGYVAAGSSAMYIGGTNPILFLTGGTGNGNESARIDSSGALLAGTSDASNTTGNGIKLYPNSGGAGVPTIGIVGNSSASGQGSYHLYSSSLNQYQFYVLYNGTINARSTSITGLSDQSEKKNVRDLETGLTEVLALRPRRFDWLNGEGAGIAGFIAQEVQPIFPDLVQPYQLSDAETKLGLKMGDMLPTLVKAIQELKAIVDTQAAKIAALEGAK